MAQVGHRFQTSKQGFRVFSYSPADAKEANGLQGVLCLFTENWEMET
jgi:hypothetical protein